MAYEVEVRHLSRISPYISVMSVTTVTLIREPHREGLFSVTIGVTVPKHASNPPSCRKPIGIGKMTSHDAHDGDDDELQRFSKGCATVL